MKYMMDFMKQYKRKVVLVVLLLLGQSIGTLLIPYLVAGVVDLGILKGNMEQVLRIGIIMVAVSLSATVVAICGSFVSADLAACFGKELRKQLFTKTQALSIQQFNEIGVSSMITRATSDIANLQQTTGLMLQLVVPAPLIIGASIVMTGMVSIPMAMIQVFFMGILTVFITVLIKKSNTLSYSIQARLDKMNKVVRESITGVRVVRAFANETYEEKRSGQVFEDYAQNMIRLNRLFAVFAPFIWLLLGIMLAVIMATGGVFVLNKGMQIGEITAVAEYAIITISYMMLAASTMTMLPKSRACLGRIAEVLSIEPAIQDGKQEEHILKSAYAIEFEDVDFAYSGAEEPVIQKLSFHCRKGETLAIIGSTGSGKSTVANLMLRLHDIEAGHVRAGGRDVRTLSKAALTNIIGCVPQKAFLFSGTIADNLRMGKKDATDQELWEALTIAQAADFVERLPEGLHAPVSQGGTNFSGGQRQRLSIARALVKKASVLVFDDSFSALDVKTDAALRKELKEKVTVPAKVIIAQRVSTIKNADQILVLDEGKLAGAGTHTELLKNCMVYQAIVRSQMN